MALTKAQVREILSAAGVDAEHMKEAVDRIIDGHVATVEALNEKINTYKADAEKLPGVQKELDDLKAAGDGGYREKYEKEHSDFEKYKADVQTKETQAAKEKAYRAILKDSKLNERGIERAVKYADWSKIELEADGTIKGAKDHIKAAQEEWADNVINSTTTGATTTTPPANNQTPAAPKSIAEALREKMNSN